MNAAQKTPSPQRTSTLAMIRTLGLVSGLCGLIIVGTYQGTAGAVAANKRIQVERSVFRVLPAARRIEAYHTLPGGGIAPGEATPENGSLGFFAAYDAAGSLVGIAAEGSARGYADTVRLMFGYDPACHCIRGIGVVSMRETPGIGDKIVSDKAFLANFTALDAGLNADLSALANEIVTVKHGSRNHPWQIDAIAGATITSRAVGRAINDAAGALLPRLVPHLEKLGSRT